MCSSVPYCRWDPSSKGQTSGDCGLSDRRDKCENSTRIFGEQDESGTKAKPTDGKRWKYEEKHNQSWQSALGGQVMIAVNKKTCENLYLSLNCTKTVQYIFT